MSCACSLWIASVEHSTAVLFACHICAPSRCGAPPRTCCSTCCLATWLASGLNIGYVSAFSSQHLWFWLRLGHPLATNLQQSRMWHMARDVFSANSAVCKDLACSTPNILHAGIGGSCGLSLAPLLCVCSSRRKPVCIVRFHCYLVFGGGTDLLGGLLACGNACHVCSDVSSAWARDSASAHR